MTLATARAEVRRISLMQRQGTPAPTPPNLPDPSTRFALIEYVFLDNNYSGAVPFDDWQHAPTIGQIIEISASIEPNFGQRVSLAMPPAEPEHNADQ